MADNVFDITDYGQYFVEEVPDEGEVVDITVTGDGTSPEVDPQGDAPAGVDAPAADGAVTDTPVADSTAADVPAPDTSGAASDGAVADDKVLDGTDSSGDEKAAQDDAQPPAVVQEALSTPDPVYEGLLQDIDTRAANIENYGLVSVIGIALILGVLICKILLDKFWR